MLTPLALFGYRYLRSAWAKVGFGVTFVVLAATAGGAALFVMAFSHNVIPESLASNAHLSNLKKIVSANARVLSTGGAASVARGCSATSSMLSTVVPSRRAGRSVWSRT